MTANNRIVAQVVVLIAVLGLSLKAAAQADQSGNFTPPLALYHGSDVEQVVLPRGTGHISIPLLHLKGRNGMDLDVHATFNNVAWSTTEIDDQFGTRIFETSPTLSGGWGIGVDRMGSLGETTKCVNPSENGCALYASYADFHTSDGSTLELGDDTGPYFTGGPSRFWSSDGTYMRIPSFSFAPDGTMIAAVHYKDGVTFSQKSGSTTLEDTNGNYISCDVGTNSCTDTVGRVVAFNGGVAVGWWYGNLSSIAYRDSSGILRNITFTWQRFLLDIPWANSSENVDPNCNSGGFAGVSCYMVDSQYGFLLTSITLPNNSVYSFEYEPAGVGATTGQISKITLPSGGYIRYQNARLLIRQ